jgi:mannosyltransferase OCH1-like enzyme
MASPIPKIIHAIWVGSGLPERYARNLRRWQVLHPDWILHIWFDKDLNWLENQNLYGAAPSIVASDAIGQFRSDVARYEVLRKYGGLYVDCDTYPLRPVDSALNGLSDFAAAEDEQWVGNTYLACTPGHPAMTELVDGLRHNVKAFRHHTRRASPLSGPRYLTPIWRRHQCYVAPTHQWFPVSYHDAKAGRSREEFDADVYAVHEWNHVRSLVERRHR